MIGSKVMAFLSRSFAIVSLDLSFTQYRLDSYSNENDFRKLL